MLDESDGFKQVIMRILIDGRILGRFGPGEYLKNIILNLARLDRENKYIVIINKGTPSLLSQDNFHFFKVPSRVKPYSLWEQILIPYLIRRLKPDLAYFPNFNIPLIKFCPYVVTIHDLIYLLYPEDGPSRLSFYYARFMLKKASEKAEIVITDSEYSRRDIIRYLGMPEDRLITIPAAAAEAFRPLNETADRDKIKEKYGVKKDFILYAGNHHRHKNILTLLEAFGHLREKSFYNLVIAGGGDWRTKELVREVQKLNLQDDVIFTGFVSPEDLPLLYNAASLFVFPSLYEGFGLSPLEAMACAVPVIASNKGSLPEVLGNAAVLIDPLNSVELRAAMEKVLGSQELRRELGRKGLEQAKSFSWRNTAEKMFNLFNKISGY